MFSVLFYSFQRSGNDDDIFTEALRFQKQLQLKSTEEAQHILKTNLEQIAKVGLLNNFLRFSKEILNKAFPFIY